MRAYVDHVLGLLPFEPAVHARLGGPPCTFVGHPIAERIAELRPNAEEARRRLAEPPVVLVLPGSRRSEVRRLLKESDVVVYTIGILGGSDPGSPLGMAGQSILDELSAVSGGKSFYPNTAAEMDEIFERIALELRHQYSIGYKPPNNLSNDGKWRKIKVKVTPPRGLPRLFVRSKEGYYATPGAR